MLTEPAIAFRVYGIPKPQPRSKPYVLKGTGKARLYDPGTAFAWRAAVRDEAIKVCPDKPIVCGVELRLTFWMPRPQHHYRTGKRAGELKANAPRYHIGMNKNDLDNLEKVVMDALTDANYWRGDGLVCRKYSEKQYGERPGVEITIYELLNEQENGT
ncbi:hypothetical protein LCGC14_0568590 [marine sediment metagenome]|uniref:Uncharacterized protein n=1 Tax=marine sediment metagenome TaxID=412755 RepID=A0A0F9UT37_9ZZZZ|nr:RusA family crossover junction endodeoxyribonuclease [Phycisphaerae bacterium]